MSEQVITVRVFDLIGSSLCVSMTDGERVYRKILPLLEKGVRVDLSFDQVNIIISAFLNAAIGQLYGKFRYDLVDDLLSCSDLESDDQDLIQRVIENAKLYYRRSEDFERAWNEELGNEDETE